MAHIGVTESRDESRVLIAGAGPTGLVLALWLTRLGIRVRIIDRASEPGTTSRALAVQARTLELYDQLDLAREVVEAGVRVANLNLWVRGERAAQMPLGRIGEGLSPHPFALVYPQDAHERLLIDHLAALGVYVERQTSLIDVKQDEHAVHATLQRVDGSTEVFRTDWLAGCDGAGSKVREKLGIEFPGGTYTGMFYVADAVASGPAVNDELHVDIEGADFVLVLPLRGKGRLRLVGPVRDLPPDSDGTLTFETIRARAVEDLRLKIDEVNWFSTYRVHHRVAKHFRSGRVFLLGDAAHIHSPVGGQGMNTGIGDAINLAWKLAAVLRGDAPASLLDTYEPERIAFARQLVATTDRAFTFVTKRSRVARIVRTRLVPIIAPLLFRIPRVRRFLFRTISQLRVNYRSSSLSHGSTGHVQGGDRLPWIELQDGSDNFAPLRAMEWQVHVYGEALPALRETCDALDLPLHVFGWESAMRRAGVKKDAAYLIRPDGYVALAQSAVDVRALRDYFTKRGLKISPSA